MSNRTSVGVRVPEHIKKQYVEHAENRKHKPSHYYRMALYTYMEVKEDFETDEKVDKIINNIQRYNDSELQEVFLERENQIISQEIKRTTFVRFMDNFLAEILMKNKQYIETGEFTEAQVKKLMISALQELEHRAKDHGFEKAFNARMESPMDYAKERIAWARNHYNDDLNADIPDIDADIPEMEDLQN